VLPLDQSSPQTFDLMCKQQKQFRGSGGAFEFIRPFLVMMGMGAMSKMIAG